MTRDDAIAEIEAAGAEAVLSTWLKASFPGDTYVTTIPKYWEAGPGEIRAYVKRYIERAHERRAVFASGDREAVKAWMIREAHSLDL